MHYENKIIQCANDRLQIICDNIETEEYIKIDETREDVINLYFVLKHFFESYERETKKTYTKEKEMSNNELVKN